MYLVVTHMTGESYRRRFRSLLCLFTIRVTSARCYIPFVVLALTLFKISTIHSEAVCIKCEPDI